ncbi:MAG: hypothetical protein Q7S40_08315 [Opitutaceae bacterium]|nr:hypothetical protein [Opitutaceae bacterium]
MDDSLSLVEANSSQHTSESPPSSHGERQSRDVLAESFSPPKHTSAPALVILGLLLVMAGLFFYLNHDRLELSKTTEAILRNATTPATPQPPILAQSDMMRFGGEDGYIGVEGKIYNPNSAPITNVRVHWQIYATPPPQAAALWKRWGYDESCYVEFAYIPAQTTYDFKSGKIKYRNREAIQGLGLTDAPMTDLRPTISFAEHR